MDDQIFSHLLNSYSNNIPLLKFALFRVVAAVVKSAMSTSRKTGYLPNLLSFICFSCTDCLLLFFHDTHGNICFEYLPPALFGQLSTFPVWLW